MLLPSLHETATFSRSSSEPFQLPAQFTYQSCEVYISLNTLTDESSWDSIKLSAMSIVYGCSQGYDQNAKTGGETTVGSHMSIEVKVGRANRI